jgi:hypothetical protein
MSARAPQPYGIAGEFRSTEHVVSAARQLCEAGVERWDVYGPAPIDEIAALVPTRRGLYITAVMVAAAVLGACVGYFYQYWGAVLDYPLNVGGRPLNGWPGFVPTAWEICALFTVYAGFFAFMVSCRLSNLYHPIFSLTGFERASQDRFFICVEAADRAYDAERIRGIFERHAALRVAEVAT